MMTASNLKVNYGNFRELVRFRVEAGDTTLAKHIDIIPSNAKYTSKIIQNELISCCAEHITNKLIERVTKSKWFSIIFDETTDISHQSPLTFAQRYAYAGEIQEDFVGFLNPRKEKISEVQDLDQSNHEVGAVHLQARLSEK